MIAYHPTVNEWGRYPTYVNIAVEASRSENGWLGPQLQLLERSLACTSDVTCPEGPFRLPIYGIRAPKPYRVWVLGLNVLLDPLGWKAQGRVKVL